MNLASYKINLCDIFQIVLDASANPLWQARKKEDFVKDRKQKLDFDTFRYCIFSGRFQASNS